MTGGVLKRLPTTRELALSAVACFLLLGSGLLQAEAYVRGWLAKRERAAFVMPFAVVYGENPWMSGLEGPGYVWSNVLTEKERGALYNDGTGRLVVELEATNNPTRWGAEAR